MNRKTLILVCLVVPALLLPFIPAFSQPEPPAFLDEALSPHQRPGSLFDHDGHSDYEAIEDCYVCHHLYEDGELVPEESSEDMKCVECHKVDPNDGSTGLVLAYHLMCKKCHEKQKAGPIACGECHVRGVAAE